MKKINFTLPLTILLLITLTVACKKDEKSTVGFSLKAADATVLDKPSDPLFHASSDVLALSWDVAWIYVTKLDLSAEYSVSSSINTGNNLHIYNFTWQGNQQVFLLAKPVAFANFELPDGTYSRIDLTLTSARLGTSSTPNFYLSGIYGPASGGIPISVTVTQQFEMNIKYDVTMNTDQNKFFSNLIELSLDQVFNGISATDLDNAEITDGSILISATHNVGLYNKILANLQAKPENSTTWSVHNIR